MNKIVFPLTLQMQGPSVADLQDALRVCLERGVILANDEATRRELASAVRRERTGLVYGDATGKAVSLFQRERRLPLTGAVDEPTASALNDLLRDWGLLDQAEPPASRLFVVSGRARTGDGEAIRGARVRAFHETAASASMSGVFRLGEDTTDADGRYTIRYEPLPGMGAVHLRVAVFDSSDKPLGDSTLIPSANPVEIVDLTVPNDDIKSYRVEGRVFSRVSVSVEGLDVAVVDKALGGDIQLAEAICDETGAFNVSFSDTKVRERGKAQPDLQVRILAGDLLVGVSEVRYNATHSEILNVLLDDKVASTLRSEHELLTGSLARHFAGRLGDLEESDDRQDVTYLANKTGWDARAVALAALADQFSARTADVNGASAVPPEYFYSLFRAGLPANEATLYHTDTETLQAIWRNAAKQGVIAPAAAEEASAMASRFQAIAARQLLTGPALVGVSSLADMLTVSGLDERERNAFAELYATNRADPARLWSEVSSALGVERAARLQVDGKLGLLTINNAELVRKLHSSAEGRGLTDPLQLAQTGYHRAQAWSRLLTPEVPLPGEIPGDSLETRRANYAEYLSAQVRLSYPTAVVAGMIKTGELKLSGASDEVSDSVYAFLSDHQGRFEVGSTPVQQYVARNQVEIGEETLQQLKRLQRVYQITASDVAMAGLLKQGVDAAYHVVRHDKKRFVQQYAAELGGEESAARVYDKSAQIHNAVVNVAVGYLNARTAPAVGVHSPAGIVEPAPANSGDLIAYATLESLFGSIDFCACDHCRSILSPAAYLVDLLLFLDQPHPPAGTENPQAVLLERRPDLQHLPLTCENTNTALPYIDLVNETLEYFIANESQKLSLKDYSGHDTSGVASEDLLSSPQFVMDSAYGALRGERFPIPLPFHHPLESLRLYFKEFGVSLPLAMERLRMSDDLERGGNPYGWRDILMEEIGLSRDEHETLTDSNAVPLWRLFGFASGTADGDVIDRLSNAKEFVRRVGISEQDLVAILRSRFINPHSELIPKLARLGVNFAELAELKTNDNAATDARFDARLGELAVPPDPAEYGGDIKAWVKDDENHARIMGLITLTIPALVWTAGTNHGLGDCVRAGGAQAANTLYQLCTTPGLSGAAEPLWNWTPGGTTGDGTIVWTCRDGSSCRSFDDLALRFSDPSKIAQNLGTAEFLRLGRFIRLWKKLKWSIDWTDAAICALFPKPTPPDTFANTIETATKLDEGFLATLPRLGMAVRVIQALNLNAKRDLLPLLACWSDIGTHGPASLYRQMFLTHALLKQDQAFDDNGYGGFLTDDSRKLADHVEALRSAFNLTAEEWDRIVSSLRFDSGTPLTIPVISAIFRRGWLARKLKLSVRELLLLIEFTGLDPYGDQDPVDPASLRLVSLMRNLKARSLKVGVALYLIWNQDLSGKSSPGFEQVALFARALRLGLSAVETDFAVAEDPEGVVSQNRLSLVYGSESASFFFGLLNETLTVEVDFADADGAMAAGPLRLAIEIAGGKTDQGTPKIGYDDFRKRLSYTGVLTAAVRDAVKLAGAGSPTFGAAVDALHQKNQAIVEPFFARYPELRPAHDDYVSDTSHTVAEKRDRLLGRILPELIKRRKRLQALQSVSAAANVDSELARALLDASAAPFPLHALGRPDRPALDDLLGVEGQGLNVVFFANTTANGPVIAGGHIASLLDYSPDLGEGNRLPPNPTPGATVSGVWSGFLEAPDNGFFNLLVEADAGASVSLDLNGRVVALVNDGHRWRNTASLELRAGALYPIRLTVENTRDIMRVQWEWAPKGQGRAPIQPRYLYPEESFQAFLEAYVRFLKSASLATALKLTAGEMQHHAIDPDNQVAGDGWLNALPVRGGPTPETASGLFQAFEALLAFALVKAEISPDDESLLRALKDPVEATANPDAPLFTLTGWNQVSLNHLLARFGSDASGLRRLGLFTRVHDALELVRDMGISAQALIQATTNEPSDEMVRGLQAALRSRYDPADWREVVRPVNDQLRGLRRDALVAYILHRMRSNPASAHIDSADKLFEYFLMDVQMEPCMQTSRIRHALSSVQLFIERCLMNLEPRVSPDAINSEQWEWMKRYRVWEANRKVYLFPENWLEPELRDDKSPFFKEIESELLQSDITDEKAAAALLNYLSKLEEVAKLEPCGIHHIPADPSRRTGEVNHVVARTAGRPRYYYRRYQFGYWTPWEQIKLDIEDDPVIPVVWNDRLFLFWLRLIKQGAEAVATPFSKGGGLTGLGTADIKSDPPKVNIKALLCWSEFLNGKWQPSRTSDTATPLPLSAFAPNDFDRSKLKLSALFWTKGAVRIIVSYGLGMGTSFFLHNAFSAPELRTGKNEPHFSPKRMFETSADAFKIGYSDPSVINLVLNNGLADKVVQPNHPVDGNAWDAPMLYADARHAFYVTTSERLVGVHDWSDFGVVAQPPKTTPDIPPLVFEKVKIVPDPVGPVAKQPGFGVTDRAPIERFVTEDAYIHKALGTAGTVTFGGKEIGPAGGQVKNLRTR